MLVIEQITVEVVIVLRRRIKMVTLAKVQLKAIYSKRRKRAKCRCAIDHAIKVSLAVE